MAFAISRGYANAQTWSVSPGRRPWGVREHSRVGMEAGWTVPGAVVSQFAKSVHLYRVDHEAPFRVTSTALLSSEGSEVVPGLVEV
jgi:hypothetical protein